MIDEEILEQIKNFNYLGCDITYAYYCNVDRKLHKLQAIWGTIV
jgi:hypothetical protein